MIGIYLTSFFFVHVILHINMSFKFFRSKLHQSYSVVFVVNYNLLTVSLTLCMSRLYCV